MKGVRALHAGGCALAVAGLLGVLAGAGAAGFGDAAVAHHGVAFAAAQTELPVWTGGHECVECHEKQQTSQGVEKPGDSAVGTQDDKASVKKDAVQKPSEDAVVSKGTGSKASANKDAGPKGSRSDATDAAATPLIDRHADLDCMLCHPDNDDMDYAHWGVDVDSPAPEKLKYSKVDSAVCLACHEADAAPKTTQDVDALTDANGLTMNPHDLPDPDGAHASVGCADCHVMHADVAPEEAAYQRCIDCHHVEVWGCACHDE